MLNKSHIFTFVLLVTLTIPTFVFASADWDSDSIDIFSSQYKIQSVMYSSSKGAAMVGLVDTPSQIFTFAECKAPQGENLEIKMNDLHDCRVYYGTRIRYDQTQITL